MEIIDFIFRVLKNISDTDVNEINKLQEKAKLSLAEAHDETKGWKGWYIRLHKGWILQTALLAFLPFVVGKLKVWLYNVYNPKPVIEEIYDDDADEE